MSTKFVVRGVIVSSYAVDMSQGKQVCGKLLDSLSANPNDDIEVSFRSVLVVTSDFMRGMIDGVVTKFGLDKLKLICFNDMSAEDRLILKMVINSYNIEGWKNGIKCI